MQHNFVNYHHMDFIKGYLERYKVVLLEYKEILRSIHGYLTQGVMNPGTLIPPNFTTKHGKEG